MAQFKPVMKKMVEPLKTGQLLVKEGFVNPEDIEQALSIQQKRRESVSLEPHRYLGMILCDLNLVTPVDNYVVLHKYNKACSISEALVKEKIMDEASVSGIRKQFALKQIPFISALMNSGKVSTNRMQKLLFDLFHIPLRSVRDFSVSEKSRRLLARVVNRETAEKQRVVPLIFKKNTILLGITDPDDLLLVHELNMQYPQYRFKAVFIPFSGYQVIFDAVYDTKQIPVHRPPAPVPVAVKRPAGPGPETPGEPWLDLSLLLKYKTVITDPEQEIDAVHTPVPPV